MAASERVPGGNSTLPELPRARVLLVEDEEAIRDLVGFHLDLSGFDTVIAVDGKEALRIARDQTFDLLVLDVVLPELDGITLCQAIRRDSANRDTPILILTARSDESDRINGLESGADDYMVKPFSIRELLARLRALQRRPRGAGSSATLSRQQQQAVSLLGVSIDPARRRVTCDGQIVLLTPREFRLLYLLASNPGVVFDRDELRTRVWTDDVFVERRGVDTLVKRLRRKIEKEPGQPARIVTVRGAGYKFGDL